MGERDDIRADFEHMVKQPEDALDLARVALLIAAESDPTLDVDAQMRTFERWADTLRSRIDPAWNNLQRLARLRTYVYEDLGFRGDQKNYYSPSNSLLHQVMERRVGIPLTISIVFMELGWRIGMPLEGVGFPGHFLVRLAGEPGDLLLDAYRDGMSVDHQDCARMLEQISGGRRSFEPEMLASIGKRAMIARLLMNLKSTYLRARQDHDALLAVDRLLVMQPDNSDEVRDRGLLLHRLQRYREAVTQLVAYLRARPEANDRESIEHQIVVLRDLIATLN